MPSPESKRIRATLDSDLDALHVPLDVQRQAWEEAAAGMRLPPGAAVQALTSGGVACEQVSAHGADPEAMLFYLHGGGFTSGSCRTHRDLAARLSMDAGLPVLLVDYRLAPEHPFPAALEDAQSAYSGLIDMGLDPRRLAVGGDSAGGGLAVSLLLSLREMGRPMPGAAVLLSAWADLALAGESMDSRAHLEPLTSRASLQSAADLYRGGCPAHDPRLSPVYADLHGLPPLLIQTGDHEILLSDSIRLAERAQAAGVEARLEVWPEMWHVWHAWAAELPEAREALAQAGDFLRRRLAAAR